MESSSPSIFRVCQKMHGGGEGPLTNTHTLMDEEGEYVSDEDLNEAFLEVHEAVSSLSAIMKSTGNSLSASLPLDQGQSAEKRPQSALSALMKSNNSLQQSTVADSAEMQAQSASVAETERENSLSALMKSKVTSTNSFSASLPQSTQCDDVVVQAAEMTEKPLNSFSALIKSRPSSTNGLSSSLPQSTQCEDGSVQGEAVGKPLNSLSALMKSRSTSTNSPSASFPQSTEYEDVVMREELIDVAADKPLNSLSALMKSKPSSTNSLSASFLQSTQPDDIHMQGESSFVSESETSFSALMKSKATSTNTLNLNSNRKVPSFLTAKESAISAVAQGSGPSYEPQPLADSSMEISRSVDISRNSTMQQMHNFRNFITGALDPSEDQFQFDPLVELDFQSREDLDFETLQRPLRALQTPPMDASKCLKLSSGNRTLFLRNYDDENYDNLGKKYNRQQTKRSKMANLISRPVEEILTEITIQVLLIWCT
jgi:hypothetical protein